nr:ORF5 [Mute swan feces associated gammacoronavirus]
MCNCKIHLQNIFGSKSILKVYTSITVTDIEVSSLCFAITLSELLKLNQLMLSFLPSIIIVNGIDIVVKCGVVHYDGIPLVRGVLTKSA